MDAMEIVNAAIAQWAKDGCEKVVVDVEGNIAGRILHAKPSGPLYRSIRRVSKVEADGFSVGTDLVYGRAWELGFSRKAYAVNPVNRKCLHWFDKGGKNVFAKYAFIPAQTFAARPFIRPGFDTNQAWLKEKLREYVGKALNEAVVMGFKE